LKVTFLRNNTIFHHSFLILLIIVRVVYDSKLQLSFFIAYRSVVVEMNRFSVILAIIWAHISNSYVIPSPSSRLVKSSNPSIVAFNPVNHLQTELKLATKEETEIASQNDFDYGKEVRRTALWVASAGGFAGIIAATKGVDSAVEFCSGYVLEQCLSVDNLFVFIVLFDYFKVTKDKQDRVLSYGITGGKRLLTTYMYIYV
jgi:hypothetical protein